MGGGRGAISMIDTSHKTFYKNDHLLFNPMTFHLEPILLLIGEGTYF